jgi:hypothetical protein
MYDVAPGHSAGIAAAISLIPILWVFLGVTRFAARHRVGWAARFAEHYRAAAPMTKAAAALMLASGVVHLALLPEHAGEVTAPLFLIDGLGFAVLSVAALVTTWWRRPAVLWLTANIFAYLVWVIAGWETPDQVGVACKLVELIALGLVMRLGYPRRRTWPRRIWRAVSLPLITTVTVAVVWVGGVAHPDALHAHIGAVLQPVAAVATPEQRAAAEQLLAKTRAEIARYQDPAVAKAAGFEPPPLTNADALLHFTNKGNEAAILDPSRPQAVVYARTKHGLLLIGAMYQMPRLGQWGPAPGGPLTQWHQHEGICFSLLGFEFSLETPFRSCPLGTFSVLVPPMLHVWIIDNPKGGPFAADLDKGVQRQLESR